MKHKTAFKPIVLSIALSILLITTVVFFTHHHNSIPSINTNFLQQKITEPEGEADREKINHFLRKFILFFVSLFATLFHFLKSDVTVAFYFTNYI